MNELKRGDKIYLDANKQIESHVNQYLDCRDGIVEVYEYCDTSGYGSKTRLFYCQDTKHESESIIRQVYIDITKEWVEEVVSFDSDSFIFLRALLNGDKYSIGGKYSLIRNYNQ